MRRCPGDTQAADALGCRTCGGAGQHGLQTVVDLPAVGENLHDHPNVTMFFMGKREVDSYYPQLYGFHRANPDSDLPPGQSDTCYVMYPARSSLREAAMRMLPTKLPVPLYGKASKGILRAGIAAATSLGVVQGGIARVWGCVVILGKPKSRGRFSLASRDPRRPGPHRPGLLHASRRHGNHDPRREARASHCAGRAARAVGQLPAASFAGEERQADSGLHRGQPDDDLPLRRHLSHGRGQGQRRGSDMIVRGTRGLRVADASVVPFTPVSAMNAPSMVIGLKAARLVLAKERSAGNSASEISGEREAWGG